MVPSNRPGRGPLLSATVPTVTVVAVTPTSVAPPLPPCGSRGPVEPDVPDVPPEPGVPVVPLAPVDVPRPPVVLVVPVVPVVDGEVPVLASEGVPLPAADGLPSELRSSACRVSLLTRSPQPGRSARHTSSAGSARRRGPIVSPFDLFVVACATVSGTLRPVWTLVNTGVEAVRKGSPARPSA